MPPELVQSAAYHPGQCVATGQSTDVVDTGIDADFFTGRIYLGRTFVEQLAAAIGWVSPTDAKQTSDQLAIAEAVLDQADMETHAMRQAVEEAESLRKAIAFTLERGFVIDTKRGTVGLRHQPGQAKIDLTRSLWPVGLDPDEQQPSEPAGDSDG